MRQDKPTTIRDFVLSQPIAGINEWLKAIEDAGLSKYQSTIIDCAIHYDRITVNHGAKFDSRCINI